jgi:hypothetical protein
MIKDFPCDKCIVFPCCLNRAKDLDSIVELLHDCPQLRDYLQMHRPLHEKKFREQIPKFRKKFNLTPLD